MSAAVAEYREKMIREAKREHEVIYPCAESDSFEECFTEDKGRLCFWFNTADDSTHMRCMVLS